MDDFNNFFDDQRQPEPERTPQYHTPTPKNNDKMNAATIICIVLAVAMCVVVLVNVVVLASLKESIAEEYASKISENMREQYKQAIDEALSGTNVIDDVTDAATESALKRLNYAVGQIADKQCSASVARLYMYTTKTSNLNNYSGSATGFLISDTDESGTVQRYVLTNAHCARYGAQASSSSRPYYGFQPQYEWKSYEQIYAYFDDESTKYELEIVAYGSYDDTEHNLDGQNSNGTSSQADIALLRIVKGTQPSNSKHPSLKIYTGDVGRGDPVALIGSPETIGDRNSITTGTISQTDISLSDYGWGNGTFLMTDAAVNSGNSGGPMINVLGAVVGIVESKLADESIDNMGFVLDAQTIIDFLTWAKESQNNLDKATLNIPYQIYGATNY